jgi:thiol-disulfide isomerase/thioredoxin
MTKEACQIRSSIHCLGPGDILKMKAEMKSLIIAAIFMCTVQATCAQKITQVKIGALQNYISRSDHPLIVNFWATYCAPCVAEIPYFQSLSKEHQSQGVELLLVSLDLPGYYPSKISAFAEQKKFSATIWWLNETNADYFCPMIDSSWSGGIPATLFVNNRAHYRKFFERQLTQPQLEENIKALLKN